MNISSLDKERLVEILEKVINSLGQIPAEIKLEMIAKLKDQPKETLVKLFEYAISRKSASSTSDANSLDNQYKFIEELINELKPLGVSAEDQTKVIENARDAFDKGDLEITKQ